LSQTVGVVWPELCAAIWRNKRWWLFMFWDSERSV